MSEEKSATVYRIRARRFMLTYDSVHADKEELATKIRNVLKKEVTYIAIAWGKGTKTGREHTHVIVETTTAVNQSTKCITWMDIYPRVDVAKSLKRWANMVQYMNEEDKDVYVWGNTTKEEKNKPLREYVLQYKTLAEAIRDNDVRLVKYIKALWEHATKEEEEYVVEELREHPWQKQLADILGYEDTDLVWVHEPIGNTGKTTWAEHQWMIGNALYYLVTGGNGSTSVDIKYFVRFLHNQHKKGWDGRYIFLDIPRCAFMDRKFDPYSIVNLATQQEHQRKDGRREKFILKNKPKVCVLAHRPPDVRKLTTDRVKVYRITNLTLQKEEEQNPLSTHRISY
jgi:hypothetical protein